MREIVPLALPSWSSVPVCLAWSAAAQAIDVTQRLDGFDAYMAKTLKDWNAPGVGVGIVVNDKLVFAKGYGYRDYEKKLPYTPGTMSPIASNTKLFTAIAAGMLVEEGKLSWDKPVRESVPAIRFYNDELNNTVTLRVTDSNGNTGTHSAQLPMEVLPCLSFNSVSSLSFDEWVIIGLALALVAVSGVALWLGRRGKGGSTGPG